MHITIDNASQFRDMFQRMGRGDQFSYEALGLLFDYLEDTYPDYALDVVEICCEFSEATPEEIAEEYSLCLDENGNVDTEADNLADTVRDFLENHTSLVGETNQGTFVYLQF